VQIQIRKVNQHARLQNNWHFAGGERGFAIDDSKGGVDGWMQSVDLHDHCVEIWHLGINVRKITRVDRVDFGHKLGQALGMLVKLDQRPSNIQPDAVMTT